MDTIAGTTKRFYYDDQRIVLQTDSDGTSQTERTFIFGNYIDEVLLMTIHYSQSTNDYYYAHDHLYSPVALFESDGDLVERYEYDVYGACRILTSGYSLLSSSAYGNPYTFTGRELDTFDCTPPAACCTLYYYRARSYDPQTGRFLQRDPVQYIEGMNLYEYVRCNPIILLDPYGLFDIDWKVKGAIYVGLGSSFAVNVKAKSEDCCCNGNIIKDGLWEYEIKVESRAGIGVGGKFQAGPIDFSLLWEGPGKFLALTQTVKNLNCGSYIPDFEKVCIEGGVRMAPSYFSGGIGPISVSAEMHGDFGLRLCLVAESSVLFPGPAAVGSIDISATLEGKYDINLDWKLRVAGFRQKEGTLDKEAEWGEIGKVYIISLMGHLRESESCGSH